MVEPCASDSAKTNSVRTIVANAKSAAGSIDFILFSGDMVKYGGRYDNWQQWNGNVSFTDYMHALCPGNMTGKLDVKGGSVLRLPDDPSAAFIGELAFSGEGRVLIKPGVMPPKARTCKLLRVGKLPEDLSRLSLHGMDEADAAEFRQSTDKKFLTVYRRK